jgi:hypothetical protein
MSRTIEVPEYALHEEVRVDPARTALVVVDMQNDFVAAPDGLPVRRPRDDDGRCPHLTPAAAHGLDH